MKRPTRGLTALAAACTSLLVLAGCSSSTTAGSPSGGASSAPSTDAAAPASSGPDSTEPVKLTVWGWLADFDKQAAMYMKLHPNVQIEVVNAGVGGPSYEKFRNAIKAGTGVPDIMMMAGATLPSFVASDDLVDLDQFGGKEFLANQTDFAAERSQVNGKMYGYSGGWGPLMYFYNKALFDKYGIEVPKTWDEFRAASEKLHQADPNVYLSNFPSLNSASAGLLWQAGQKPFATDGTTVAINWDSPEAQKVSEYWQGMLDDGLTATVPDFTADWGQAIANGKFASFIGGAWYPGVIAASAPDQAGDWRVAQLPQWTAGDTAGADAGFAVLAIPKLSTNQAAAADFAKWVTGTDEGVQSLHDIQVLFPTYKPLLDSPKLADEQNAFFGNQQINKEFIAAGKGIDYTYDYGPFYDYATGLQDQAVGQAMQGQVKLPEAMTTIQQQLVQYAQDQGYTVK